MVMQRLQAAFPLQASRVNSKNGEVGRPDNAMKASMKRTSSQET
jgi:hypothetical protein